MPSAKDAGKLSEEVRDFYSLIANIVKELNGEEPDAEELQTLCQRFERKIVSLRFSSDANAKAHAVALIKAIFADADYFSGLKPLPQYTDAFAYELLFPTWLNLLAAVMLPQAKSGKPRLEGTRQGDLFAFLGKVHALELACEEDLVGFATFIASRFDAPLCEELLQRLAELFSQEGADLIASLNSLEQGSKDARQFARRLQDYLVVKHCYYQWPATSEHPIAYKRPSIRVLPEAIREKLTELEQGASWNEFSRIARRMRLLIQSEHILESGYVSLLNEYPGQSAALLRFVIHENEDGSGAFLPEEAQTCLAHLITLEISENGKLDVERIGKFATEMAANLEGFNDGVLGYFCRIFVKDAKNRKMMLDACQAAPLRTQLADFVLGKAGKVDDDSRFLQMLACVTVFSPEDLSSAQNTLKVIDAVVQNRSIGTREYGDLVSDMQANLTDVLQYLSMPLMAASGKDPRMASLYLTLNEVAESFGNNGKVENFSVVRAKYSKLTNM